MPFETEMLGVTVLVEKIDLLDDDSIVAVCRRGQHRKRGPSSTCRCRSSCLKALSGWRRTGVGDDLEFRGPRALRKAPGFRPVKDGTPI